MREQITFAVDATGCAHYVGLSSSMKRQLSIEEAGALIDEWPGDFPGNLKPGFYTATLDVSGSLDNPILKWTEIQKMTTYPPWAKVTKLPEHKEKKASKRKEPANKEQPMAIRVRKDGRVFEMHEGSPKK